MFKMLSEALIGVENLMARRSDGDFIARAHPYRRMLGYLMPGRNEAVVYYEDLIKADAILDYIKQARVALGQDIGLTHCLVAASSLGLHFCPEMNRFVVGKRLYQRNNATVTFSMKRKQLDKKAKVSAVKLATTPEDDFLSIITQINQHISVERSDAETYTDKELGLLNILPRPLLSGAMSAVRLADYYNVLPHSFIKNDAFYTSLVIANLGSLGMKAGFHHLYEWGTSPLFMMVGKVEERAMVEDGKVVARKVLPVHYSYDERIDDGLTSFGGLSHVRHCLEDPEKYFGKLP